MLRTEKLTELDVAAASGLVADDERFFVVADDEPALLEHRWSDLALCRRHALFDERWPALPAARKRAKADLECLLWLDGAVLAFGSGSLPNRRRGTALQPATGEVRGIDLAALYTALEAELPELNVEGAAVVEDALLLFQRGNGRAGENAVISLALAAVRAGLERGALDGGCVRAIDRVALGELAGTPLSFTDACFVPGVGLLYTAAAEASPDTVADGPCAGSVVGLLDTRSEVRWSLPLDVSDKVEGLFARRAPGERVEAFLVADADDPTRRAPLLRAVIEGVLPGGDRR